MYARLTVQNDGRWNVEIQADETRSTEYDNLAQAISACESSWQEHRITLQHVDSQIEQANRRV